MNQPSESWVIILAAGEGSRLRALTTGTKQGHTPKQFWSPSGEGSMLSWTLDRAKRLVPNERIVVVVAEQHESWWRSELESLDQRNVIVQPQNRGTGVGLLLPLLHVAKRSPNANVIVLPSDHYVEYEWVLTNEVFNGLSFLDSNPQRIVMLGMEPDRVDEGLGWIEPAENLDETISSVRRFVEKPPAGDASKLSRLGALVNSFILVGRVAAFLDLYFAHQPQLVEEVSLRFSEGEGMGSSAHSWFSDLPQVDFSSDLLEPATRALAVVRVPYCGWSDLGTPSRVRRCLQNQWSTAPAARVANVHRPRAKTSTAFRIASNLAAEPISA